MSLFLTGRAIGEFTQVYKTMSLFLTGRAIGGIYKSLQNHVTFSHRQGDRGNL
jgi:hypothetical protein